MGMSKFYKKQSNHKGFKICADVLEKTKGRSHESLLVSIFTKSESKNLHVLEGCSSNFFAIYKDGIVRTATDDAVLCGAIRKLVCNILTENDEDEGHLKREKAAIKYEPPNLIDAENLWKGCFITSTSRLALPIRHVIIPDDYSIIKNIYQLIDSILSDDAKDIKNKERRVFKLSVASSSKHHEKVTYTVIQFSIEINLIQYLCSEVNKRILSLSSAI